MKTIKYFKGQTVYDPFRSANSGIISEILNSNHSYPIVVSFQEGMRCYTLDGFHIQIDKLPTLSTTPYTLQGFKQFSIPDIKKGTPILVQGIEKGMEGWFWRAFSHFNNDGTVSCFLNGNYSGRTDFWEKYALSYEEIGVEFENT